MKNVSPEGGFRNDVEKTILPRIAAEFSSNPDSLERKLDNFPKYIRRQRVTRYLALYELFKKVLPLKGSIVECGVNDGFSLMSWANFSAVLEPNNIMRRIYGFDTFEGFKSPSMQDQSSSYSPKAGDLTAHSYEELINLIGIYDDNRFLGHVDKVHLVKGDIAETIPTFLKENPHIVVSLLFLDVDLYEPTKIALEQFVQRMPGGSVLAFDELDNPIWPGETLAMFERFQRSPLKLERFEFDPYISFAIL